ncbi:antitoxin YefM [Duganella sp. CF402]|uniref:type II toxin-antitoxin system Phd/YefM family antitoxin n=1 Tax=unclassified Duganella TaxID=2636909 RepID=UPI0008C06E99|nr:MULTISPECIES: type II toxin-antitoxin system Phd/YefM family antitoxin [unclassified Duganella]RZT05973.1 antitoxin YefM [Duganella sp. BK701]SEN14931.1 antitoxin YefM [Duganella sp. CF402]
MKVVRFAETGNNLNAVLNDAAEGGLTVLRDESKPMVIIALAEYNGLMETAYLLSSPNNASHLAASLADLRAGRVAKHELIEAGEDHVQPYLHK